MLKPRLLKLYLFITSSIHCVSLLNQQHSASIMLAWHNIFLSFKFWFRFKLSFKEPFLNSIKIVSLSVYKLERIFCVGSVRPWPAGRMGKYFRFWGGWGCYTGTVCLQPYFPSHASFCCGMFRWKSASNIVRDSAKNCWDLFST